MNNINHLSIAELRELQVRILNRIMELEWQRPTIQKGVADGWLDRLRQANEFRKNIGNPNPTLPQIGVDPMQYPYQAGSDHNPSDMIGKNMFPNPLREPFNGYHVPDPLMFQEEIGAHKDFEPYIKAWQDTLQQSGNLHKRLTGSEGSCIEAMSVMVKHIKGPIFTEQALSDYGIEVVSQPNPLAQIADDEQP